MKDSLHNKVKAQIRAEIAMALSDADAFKQPLARNIFRIIDRYMNWIEKAGGFDAVDNYKARDREYITTKERLRIKEEGGFADGIRSISQSNRRDV